MNSFFCLEVMCFGMLVFGGNGSWNGLDVFFLFIIFFNFGIMVWWGDFEDFFGGGILLVGVVWGCFVLDGGCLMVVFEIFIWFDVFGVVDLLDFKW